MRFRINFSILILYSLLSCKFVEGKIDWTKHRLPDGLYQQCQGWSMRYQGYIPPDETCDNSPLTFMMSFLSSGDVMPGYMVEEMQYLPPPPPGYPQQGSRKDQKSPMGMGMSGGMPRNGPPQGGPPPNMMPPTGQTLNMMPQIGQNEPPQGSMPSVPPRGPPPGQGLGIASAHQYKISKHLIGNYTDDAWKCKTLVCLCPHLGGRVISEAKTCFLPDGKILKKAVRKEYRTSTDEERHKFHGALKKLMENGVFDEISSIHVYVAQGSSVHGRPKFWSWHRKYLKKIEIELRKIDPDLFLPYWDTTLDQGIPNPYDSIMWSDDFMGRSDDNGTVISGPANHWITLNKKPLKRRKKSDGLEGELYKENDLRLVLKETQVDRPRKVNVKSKWFFDCPIQLDLLETAHATAHDFIGGDMADLESASNEPAFYMLHCFIDLIYEIWRQQKDPNCHAGLVEEEPDETFGYAPRPRCSQENPDCGSNNLFCDLSLREPRCAAKIRSGGICMGLRNEDKPCYTGNCVGNRCLDESVKEIIPIPSDFKDKRPEEANNPEDQEDLDLYNFAIKEYKLMLAMMAMAPKPGENRKVD